MKNYPFIRREKVAIGCEFMMIKIMHSVNCVSCYWTPQFHHLSVSLKYSNKSKIGADTTGKNINVPK
jgi:hypothetical protein